ncbi:MAG: hybrid sensor histidine kinase/response regulator, partial [Planctomycetia bacterium]
FSRRNEDLSGRLHHEVIVSRMRPLADGVRALPRLVRDLARTLGKQVRFETRGEQTGVDRDILDKLEAPLSHLLRNAVDHGIESPAEREAAGKPAEGTIVLEARHRAGMLQIQLFDDGRGIDFSAIRDRAVERELVPRHVADRLTEAEVAAFLFLPGFSTRRRVTEFSGRGVGLDVVQSMVKAVGGSVRVSSASGRQTAFTLQLPITMSVVRALLAEVASEPYAFPLTRIDHIQFVPHADVKSVEGRQFFHRDSESIGLVSATQVLGMGDPAPPPDPMPVVVISDRGQRFGMIVDAFLGERDLEVRPLDPRLGKVADVNSVSLLEDGAPVLIVDVEDLVLSIDNLLMGRRIARVDFEGLSRTIRRTKRVLVVDDSVTVRELERQLLRMRGFEVDVAVDGMDGWNAVRGGDYDLVVSDVDMPRLDGIGLVSLIKGDAARRNIPVVIVSYKDREEDRLRGLEAGAIRYLTKTSFHDQTFIATIVDLIGEPVA